MADTIRWGILGTGNIARKFAEGLTTAPGAQLVAVGSRTQTSADRFADQFNAPRRHTNYEALANDPQVDVIYIATPHNLHKDNSLLCLNAGKAVLCEKPFTINAAETDAVIQAARARRLFLMEAMWTRCLPAFVKIRELIRAGALGEVRMVTADFGFRTSVNAEGRLFNKVYGGGSLLDVGVYPVSLASMLLGTPTTIKTLAYLGQTGVDEQAAMIFGYRAGQLALLSSAIRTSTPHEALIAGTEGTIKIADWWRARQFTLIAGGKTEIIELPFEGNGYNYEAVEVMRCLCAGQLESEVMPLDESRAIMATMDAVRAQWGLTYPSEA
jgi:predicted dehydrogenase